MISATMFPATPPLKSAALSSPQSDSAHRWLWFWATLGVGPVLATLEELMRPREKQSRNLRSIVDRIRPSLEALLATELRHDSEALLRHAIHSNVRVSANHPRHGSELLEARIQREGLLVVGAEYSLETGVVDFFDGVPDAG